MKSRYLIILKIIFYTIYDDVLAFFDNQKKYEYNSWCSLSYLINNI